MASQAKRWIVFAGGLSLLLAELVIVPMAEAIVGRPATPVSAAGVARRTCRRTVAVASTETASAAASQQAAAQSAAAANEAATSANQAAAAATAAAATPAPAPTPMVASLPDGCVSTGEVFQCGSVYYKPYLQGTTVVYAQVPGP